MMTIHNMDCRMAMSMLMDADSVDSIVTDPPYGLSKEPDMAEVLRHWLAGDDYTHTSNGFMGKSWDSFVPGPSVWREAYRVLKPGGYLVAFFGTRTYDLGVLALRLAGFEIRDQLAWVFGSGFPKSLDVSKAIESHTLTGRSGTVSMRQTAMGEEYQQYAGVGQFRTGESASKNSPNPPGAPFQPTTDAARQWQGWGTALKPAYEPIVLARKPLAERTVAANVLAHGTGAINIDGCRVPHGDDVNLSAVQNCRTVQSGDTVTLNVPGHSQPTYAASGRWPANLCHDGSDEVLAGFPHTKSGKMLAGTARAAQDEPGSVVYGTYGGCATTADTLGDSGSAARFFYCAKASRSDRNEGLADPGPQLRHGTTLRTVENTDLAGNSHPTVKPTDLMRWLVRLVTPPGGTVFDPFTGSGSTGKAAALEGFPFVGCELDPNYAAIAEARILTALSARGTSAP